VQLRDGPLQHVQRAGDLPDLHDYEPGLHVRLRLPGRDHAARRLPLVPDHHHDLQLPAAVPVRRDQSAALPDHSLMRT
jgi:hypothetical protein